MTTATISVEEAQSRLPDLVAQLSPGKDVLITSGNRPVARLIAEPAEKPYPMPGRCTGMLTILSDDEDHLEDWAEYLP